MGTATSSTASTLSISSSSATSGQTRACFVMSNYFIKSGSSPRTVIPLANDTRRGSVSPREGTARGKHSSGTSPGGAPEVRIHMCRFVSCATAIVRVTNDNNRGSIPPPPEHWIRKWVLVNTILVDQMASEQSDIHRHPREVWSKGRLPQVPCHRPWREELCNILKGDILRPSRCPRQSLTEPFQTVHHSTGYHHNCPNSRWTCII